MKGEQKSVGDKAGLGARRRQEVSPTAHSEDQTGLAGIGFDLAAQPKEDGTDGALRCKFVGVVIQCPMGQLAAGEHLTKIGHQGGKHGCFAPGQRCRPGLVLVFHHHGLTLDINGQWMDV